MGNPSTCPSLDSLHQIVGDTGVSSRLRCLPREGEIQPKRSLLKNCKRSGETASRVKPLAAKLEDLSSILRTRDIEEN